MDINEYFKQRFPEMTPVTSVPTLSTVNGIGLMLYGRRDYDYESQSYVATHFFCVLFVPIFAVGAYRVVDAQPDGWFFLGKVPLSKVTRGWNIFLALAIMLGGLGAFFSIRANDPDVVAGNQLAEGDQLAASGKIGAAAAKYQQIANNKTSNLWVKANQKLADIFNGPLDTADPAELIEALRVGALSFKHAKQPGNVYEAGLKQGKQRSAADPQTAWKIFEVIAPIAPPNDQQIAELKRPLLEQLLAKNTDDVDAASDLAAVYESEKKFDRCEKLLTPLRAKLGSREGARILGQILAKKGEFELALPLLQGYVEPRVQALQAADKRLNDTNKRLADTVINQLKTGTAPGFDFKRANQLKDNPQAQDQMVQAYLMEKLLNNPEFKQAKDALDREARLVPVAFDLGMALMRQSQTVEDINTRRELLEKAEKTFVGLQGVAGKSDEFRLTLGQVYYWLGKQDQGRKLFDEVLQATNRAGRSLVMIAGVLRELGEISEARKYAEEAYNKEAPGPGRDNAANFRAHVALDLDDRILWLTRVAKQEGNTLAELCYSRGEKASIENRDAEAVRELRACIQHYAAMPESTASLNNSALAYFSLYRVTGSDKDLTQGITNLEKAVELDHRNSILVTNAADSLKSNAMRALLGNGLDWKALKMNGSIELVSYFYNDQKSKDAWRAKFKKSEGIAKARTYYERLLVLAPKNASHYVVLSSLYSFARDEEALKQLRDRIAATELDHADATRRLKDTYQDKDRAKNLKDVQNAADADAKRVTDARKIGGATLAVALGRLVHDKIALLQFDGVVDTDQLVALAEEAHKAAPSRATEGLLIEALCQRAHRQLIVQDARYGFLAKRARRSLLSPQHLVAVGLAEGGATQKACLAHADIVRVNGLIKTQCETYDEEFSEWAWAMLRHADKDWADAKAKVHVKNEFAQASAAINQRSQPLSAGEGYRQAWALQMRGQDAEATAVLLRCVEQGIPMPFGKE